MDAHDMDRRTAHSGLWDEAEAAVQRPAPDRRAALAADTARFLAGGGRIVSVLPGVSGMPSLDVLEDAWFHARQREAAYAAGGEA